MVILRGGDNLSVYNKLLHAEELRLLGGIIGAALMATAINLFIVPQGFYAGGAYGMCQVIRTLLVTRAGLTLPFDLAGLLYLMVNLPLFIWRIAGWAGRSSSEPPSSRCATRSFWR